MFEQHVGHVRVEGHVREGRRVSGQLFHVVEGLRVAELVEDGPQIELQQLAQVLFRT